MTRGPVHVVAGAVIGADGKVLIAQRPDGRHLAGHWEFPGGKLEPGETRAEGLKRELHEELGIDIREPRPLVRARHTYSTREVLIDLYLVTRYSGTPQGLDGQALRWCRREELSGADLLPADGPMVRLLSLPERITAAWLADAGSDVRLCGVFCDTVAETRAAALDRGTDFIVLRQPLPDTELAALCAEIMLPVYTRGLHLERAWALGATGVVEP